jgi:tetrahydromethanopterin S-methyltransferase subunit G
VIQTETDDLGPAKGILLGVVFGLVIWLALIVCGRELFAAIMK